ncbi:TM0106 family RecB-like putative nuclease [soil metagenome]
MRFHNGAPLYSAKDLLTFLGCTHSSALDLQLAGGAITADDDEDDPYLELLKEKGNAHEAHYLEDLKRQGRSVREIARVASLDEMAELTRAAMREGVDVIYQGALVELPWHGYSDFLLRVEKPSALGPWSYEVADTKLARSAKPKHVLQLCLYSQMVAREQDLMPTNAHVVLGDSAQFTFALNDYIYYCDAAKRRFLSFMADKARETFAEPCEHCGMCRWSGRCEKEWDETDHLSLVARLAGPQARKLRSAGVTTLRELAELPTGTSVSKLQPETLARLRDQAKLQFGKRATGTNAVETLPLEPRRGFARLPEPDAGDLFFDMEGDPVYSPEGSLEYLFGFHFLDDDGKETFRAFWAHDRASEKTAFEGALDFIVERLRRFPKAYVYHYAAYEETALRRLARQYGTSKRQQDDAIMRLAQAHGTRENEVDDLLRDRKLVDLYKVVREGIRISEPSYSLKNLEVFFAEERTETIKSGGDSVVAFERWLVLRDDAILKEIEVYNAFDCRSTMQCRDWLLTLRPAEVEWFDPAQEKSDADAEKEAKRRLADAHILELREQLAAGAAEGDLEWRELLGHLLEYHRREARREWWDYFKRLGATREFHIDDIECIGGLVRDPAVPPRPEKRSMLHTFTFPDQEFKLKEGSVVRADTGKSLEIFTLDEAMRRLELKVGPSQAPLVDDFALIPCGPRDDTSLRDAIERFAVDVIAGRTDGRGAVLSILRRDLPRMHGDVILHSDDPEALLTGTVDAIARMRDTHLVIQGPPGTGKTYTSAHAIVSLLESGKRVGVTSMTHKAINNLLECVEELAAQRGVTFKGVKKNSEDEQKLCGTFIVDMKDNKFVGDTSYQLIAGTAWLFARSELDGALDYLFIDEAGQVCLANVVAMGGCARDIVLVGDQMQLAQPVKGAHPGGSGVSALDYLMRNWATVPRDRGILLARTWRMHPALCGFVSAAYYDSRLEPHVSTSRQAILGDASGDDGFASVGLRFAHVQHDDCSQRSTEEAERVAELYDGLLGREWINRLGETNEISVDDILVVSPYNMQVKLPEETLPHGARVGTVDRFQGQEAAAVLVSMACSSGDQAPRGLTFLFSRNRMNVAISRGRCVATVVASPELTAAACRTLEAMRLVNSLCWAEDYAAADSPTASSKFLG